MVNTSLLGRRARARSEDTPLAPVYHVQDQEIYAVEHPMIIQNLDRALKTFGTNRPFRRILDSDDPEECLPLYLRPNDPLCVPVLSVNAPTTNVVLKITVPKRTGRKRKRGSQDPYTNSDGPTTAEIDGPVPDVDPETSAPKVRNDKPAMLRRMLQDNVGKYAWEAIGKVKHTHRFRGLSDFQQSTGHGRFISNLKQTVLGGQMSDLSKFELDPKMGVEPLTEIIPPPAFTNHSIPFNWAWQQNPHIFIETDAETGANKLINHSANTSHTAKYLPRDSPIVPTRGPTILPVENSIKTLLAALKEAFDERPLWTRRGLMNRLGHMPSFYLLRNALPYVGYMFKGGPFRDAVIKYGVDPRADPKYRMYQTFFFKVFSADDNKEAGDTWEDLRTTNRIPRIGDVTLTDTHHFDGVNLTLDGKVWQVCDITDPLLKKLIDSAPLRETCDKHIDGWFTNGRLAKIKAIMKVKLVAIRTNKTVTDEDFADALAAEDVIPGKSHRTIHVPVPDLRLSEQEVQELQEKGVDLQSLGITLLRKREHQGNLHAKRARGTDKKAKRGKYKKKEKEEKRGKYQRKETRALLEMGVDSALEKLKQMKKQRGKKKDVQTAPPKNLRGPNKEGNMGERAKVWAAGIGKGGEEDGEVLMDSIEADGRENREDDGDVGGDLEEDGQSAGDMTTARDPNEFGIDDEGDRSDARTEDEDEAEEEEAENPHDESNDSDATDEADFQHLGSTSLKLHPSSGIKASGPSEATA